MQTAAISSLIAKWNEKKKIKNCTLTNNSIVFLQQQSLKTCIYAIRVSYHEKLSFIDSFISIGVKHVEGDLETSFWLYNEIDYRDKFIAIN